MSTRCNIHFADRYGTDANVYRHCDGYPDGILPDLDQFFADVEAATGDTRFADPSYLAARFVAWQVNRYAKNGGTDPMAVIGVGIMEQDAGDAAYIYRVTCNPTGDYPPQRPVVEYRKASEKRFRAAKPASPVAS